MPLDPDQIRVDILKVQRKIFLSYPQGSKEREDFLRSSKIHSINYLSKLVPKELASEIFDEFEKGITEEIQNIAIKIFAGSLFPLIMFILHLYYPKVQLLNLWAVGWLLVIPHIIPNLLNIYKHWKKFEPFKKEYLDLQERIKKLQEDLGNP